MGGELWLTSSEFSNTASNLGVVLALTPRYIRGSVVWGDTAQRVPGATIRAWDNDPVGREAMGQATSDAAGAFTIRYNGRRQWDTCERWAAGANGGRGLQGRAGRARPGGAVYVLLLLLPADHPAAAAAAAALCCRLRLADQPRPCF